MKFSSLINISIHALTLPLVLNIIYTIINTITGFTIRHFTVVYTSIACIYIITAILLIRSNFIKQHIEMQKIMDSNINTEDVIYETKPKEKNKEKETEDENENKEEKENGEAKEGGLA